MKILVIVKSYSGTSVIKQMTDIEVSLSIFCTAASIPIVKRTPIYF
jgi:hypothetical protein